MNEKHMLLTEEHRLSHARLYIKYSMPSVWMNLIQLLSLSTVEVKVKGIIPIFFITVLKRDPRGEGEGIVMPPITSSSHPHPTTLNLILSLLR